MAVLTGDEVWADFKGDGSINEPLLQNIRVWSRYIELLATTAGWKVYTSKAAMDADTTQPDGTPALIFSDPTPANNFPTVWVWDDAGNEWDQGTDRISSLAADVDALKALQLQAGLQNRFPDPEGLGLASWNKDGVRIFETIGGDAQPVVQFTVSGTNNIYDIKAEGEFAPGAIPTFSGIRRSDVVGAALTFNAPVSLRYFDTNAVETTVTESRSTTGTAWEAFSLTGPAIPAGTGFVRLQFGKGSVGTFGKVQPRSILLTSDLSPAGLFRPRDLSAKFITGMAGARRCTYYDGAWRDDRGLLASTADGPCALAGTKAVWDMRRAVSVADQVTEITEQRGTARLIAAGGGLGVRDKRGILAGSGTGRLASANSGIQTAKLLGVHPLPNSTADVPPNGGFAGTGYAEIPSTAATWAGCIVAANHGRANEADATSNASIIILSPVEGRERLAEYNQSATTGTGSIQGVAVRTVGGVSTILYVDKSAKLVRELSLTGALTGLTVDMSAITPNGLAYDPANDAVWVSNEGVAEARRYAVTTGVQQATTVIPANTDQMSFVNGYLSVSYGNNGSPGTIDLRDPETNCLVTRLAGLPYSEAIEGHFWREMAEGWVLTYGVDGSFHIIAKPSLGLLVRCAVPAPPPRANTDELLVMMAVRSTGTISQTGYVIADGSPLDVVYNGWGVGFANATTARAQVRTNGDAAVFTVDFQPPGLGVYPKLIAILFSRSANTIRGFYKPIGGTTTEMTATGSNSIAGLSQKFSTIRIPHLCGVPGATVRDLNAADVTVAGVWDATTAVQASVEAYIDQLAAGLAL